jgi:hypothetical protein
MNIRYLILVPVCMVLFLSNCLQETSAVNTPYSNDGNTKIKISTEDLCQHWFHSSEEQGLEAKVQIFRPKGFKALPATRFRMQYIFHKNGDCEWYYLSPDDNHHFKKGKWRIKIKDTSILMIEKDSTIEMYRVIELKKDILRMVEIRNGK